jgi:uncharacterized protein
VKVVFDTNVLISAFAAEGVCAKLLRRARRRHFDLVACREIVNEFQQVLKRKFGASADEVRMAASVVAEATSVTVSLSRFPTPVCRDATDDKVLACAQAAQATYLVTGDRDLLVLKKFGKTRIVTPREFELLFEE